MILTVEGLSKSYGLKRLFTEVSFAVNDGEKIGVVGVNGAGKSTLLRTIAGLVTPDAGTITPRRGLRIGYLEQEREVNPDNSVLAEALRGTRELSEAFDAYEHALSEVERAPEDKAALGRLSAAGARIDALDGWQAEGRARTILTKLGLGDFAKSVGELSGGEQKRLALAAALLQPCDLLLLDEPTNHLDSEAIRWLEEYLAGEKTALVMVTHDRYFLDRTAQRILEIDKGEAYYYTGNYSQFLEQKEARIERMEAEERKRQNFLRHELEWIRRGAQARSTKQRARIERYEAVKNQTVDLSRGQVEIGLAGSRLGRTVIELKDVCCGVEGRPLVRDLTYTVLRRDRVALLGPNGSGKTTLLNVFAGRLAPQSGTVSIGQTVKAAFFTQDTGEMDMKLRAVEYIREAAHHLTLADGTRISASQLMERFLFPNELQWAPLTKLSGGERRRLFLLRLLMSEPNVLLLDEPTRDLDLETLAVLEGFIEDFAGAIIFVSHDRAFVDRLAERVLVPDGTGRWQMFAGGYSDYLARVEAENEAAARSGKAESPAAKAAEKPAEKTAPREHNNTKQKLSFKEQKEYAEIEDIIASREAELRMVEKLLETAGADYTRLTELTAEQERLTAELERLMERWEYLESVAGE